MMKPKKTGLSQCHSVLPYLLALLFTCSLRPVWANNLVIGNVTFTGRNTTLHFTLVDFDVSWENSWRTSMGPANWDAAWIFIKYRVTTQTEWNHATLNWVDGSGNNDGHVVPPGATIASSNDNGSGGSFGVFIYHNTDLPQSAVNYTNVRLRWNYGLDGVGDNDKVEVCVIGIEMVHIPQGSYMLGDGSNNISGQFHDAAGTNIPYQVTSENAITLGGGAPGSLGNNNNNNVFEPDDFDNTVSQTLPASYPKGFKAFYCMKYEITQAQYAFFLNKLSYTQQRNRTQDEIPNTPPNSPAGTHVLTFFGTPYRNSIVIRTPGVDPATPAVYACDLNDNGIFDEPNDGQNIACNNLEWAHVTAYLDWAALRPMTEMEFEKVCRGSAPAVADEFAWGSTAVNMVSGVVNGGMTDEAPSDPNANCNMTDWTPMNGPVRVGSFGQGSNSREATGASYYGVMEMTGNLWERTVSVGNVAGRAFIGTHGDGKVSKIFILGQLNIGDADTPDWPDNTAAGSGFRGGSWYSSDFGWQYTSNRFYATSRQPIPLYSYGGRGVRTAPY